MDTRGAKTLVLVDVQGTVTVRGGEGGKTNITHDEGVTMVLDDDVLTITGPGKIRGTICVAKRCGMRVQGGTVTTKMKGSFGTVSGSCVNVF